MAGRTRKVSATDLAILECGLGMPEQEKAFVYGLYLTGARTAELAGAKAGAFRHDAGEWFFTLPVLKRHAPDGKKPIRIRPFFPWTPTSEQETMLKTLLDWAKDREPEELLFQYSRPKGGGSPYDKITRKGFRIHASEQIGEGGSQEIDDALRLHWPRRFRITNLLLATNGATLFVRDFIGQKSLDSTLHYWNDSKEAFLKLRTSIKRDMENY